MDLKARAGVPIYGVNYKDDAVAARRFLGRYGNPFKAVGTDKAGRSAIEWGVYGMPETFVINGQGRDRLQARRRHHAREPETKLLPAIAQAARRASPPLPTNQP